jgi:peptide/nickel transport system substrate-binding protein/oligopeptide transport system substrate-binding protein
LPAAEAVDRFNDGDVDLVLGGTIADFPLTRSVGILRGTIQLDPVIGLFGLSVLDEDGFLAEPANREALAMAIDRDALIEPFGVAGWKPSSRISAPEVDSGAEPPAERWDGLDIEQRRARAAARVSAWLAAQEGAEAVELTLRLPDGPGSDMLFTRLRDSFTPIGVVLARAEKDKKADLELIDDVARYPAPTWFLHRLNCKARKSACSKEADDLVAEAMRTVDVAGRALLLREAEDTLIAANTYIPLGAPIRWSLVRGNVSGFASNRFGWHPLMPLAMRPK